MFLNYIRVSTADQNVERQLKSIEEYIKEKNIQDENCKYFIDKQSGADFSRQQYQLLKQQARAGDTVLVTSLDRLGRNKQQIKEELEYFRKQQIKVVILDIPITGEDFNEQSWIQEMIINIIIEVISTFAEKERDCIKDRQRQGIEIAKAKGVYKGRSRIQIKNWDNIFSLYQEKKITAKMAAKMLDISVPTFYRRVKETKNN